MSVWKVFAKRITRRIFSVRRTMYAKRCVPKFTFVNNILINHVTHLIKISRSRVIRCTERVSLTTITMIAAISLYHHSLLIYI